MGRATWCRRHGTPSTIPQLGVPIEPQKSHLFTKGRGTLDPGRATLVQLSREAWSSMQQGRGTPYHGRATLVQVSRGKEKWREAKACHLSSKAWHAKVVIKMSVPLEGLGVARQARIEEACDTPLERQPHASWKVTLIEFLFPPKCNFPFSLL
ncbi:uncharacterized protein DS421_18g621460 [Arachis hypogaea]|nr:uncharacterized protein DS421_18g621460 [Arachis hypogaea]